eukprot:Mycagemm_TRINITY_DN10274_c0_g1::TRINITY_DN10274_c0_g1_i1::g.4161::m.4161 type:complete len:101 gc:universal TRINITY_DN10274_c0_g1_i1:119-421(+)
MRPLAVLKRLMGECPSVIMRDLRPRPLRSLACISGPARAIEAMVLAPIASTMSLNLTASMSARDWLLVISSSFSCLVCVSSACCRASFWARPAWAAMVEA